MENGVLSNRELAGLIWLGVLAIYVLRQPGRGTQAKSIGALIRTLATPKLIVPLVLYASWLAAGIWFADRVGLWDSSLLKPTVVWALFAGIGLYFGVTKALQQEAFFKSALLATLGASALVEFYVSFQSFPLVVELIAQPIVGLAVMMAVLAERKPGQESVVKVANSIAAAFGLASLVWVAWNVVARWSEIDGGSVARELLMQVWLTPIALAFVYVLALYAGYEQAFVRIDWKAGDRSTWRQKAAFLSVAGIRLKKLRQLHGAVQMRVADETTFRGARRAVALAEQYSEGADRAAGPP